jgi:type III restriction enzyme
MPTLHWLDRDRTIKQASQAPYPLFELDLVRFNNGKILVVEHKGSKFAFGNDSDEKELIGNVWAEKSGNLFLMAWKKDSDGKNVNQQINQLF